jgi:Flp pilus assembly protein TadG
MSATSKVRHRASVGWRGRIRARCGDDSSERGAVLVEAAFVLPVLLLLIFGMIEFGLVFKDSLTLSEMVQAGARVGSELGSQSTDLTASPPVDSTDFEILTAVMAASHPLNSTIQYVTIFNADGANGNVPAGCSGANAASVPGECNVYPGAYVESLGTTQPANFSNYDSSWPPSSRNVTEQTVNGFPGPDYIGVYISAIHSSVTGIVPGGSIHLSDTAVLRLEPQSFQQ